MRLANIADDGSGSFREATEMITTWKRIRPMSQLAVHGAEFFRSSADQGNLAAAVASMTDAYLLDRNDPEGRIFDRHCIP